ncbi:hypothetical protein O6H91_07G032900 [Diphasiastrum complanatum]|uniref:Uncharacterized protein n=1 Tax=Diphasiastrum complanatum TaxID=34168 RepID=A0ACC2D464_DIPCM|nr:hypothetical protein O6H91_07G032900 [Diphasiastrum complanatum]
MNAGYLCYHWRRPPAANHAFSLRFLITGRKLVRLLCSQPKAADQGKVTKVFIVAGEPSGDAIGSRIMASLKHMSQRKFKFAGVGGVWMEREGLHSKFQMEDIAVMGTLELVPHALKIWARLRQTIAAVVDFNPDLVLTIDSKGFTFRVLKGIKAYYELHGRPCPLCIHYVAPSVWAWKGGEHNVKILSKLVDHVLCILPFEEDIFRSYGVAATYVGHPVLEDAFDSSLKNHWEEPCGTNWKITGDALTFRKQHRLSAATTLVSVLPGSRMQEVRRMLPIFGTTLTMLKDHISDLAVIIPTVSSKVLLDEINFSIKQWNIPVVVLAGASQKEKYDAFSASDAGLCTSGTAVLQLQMARLPCVVAYRAHPVTEWIIKHKTKLRYMSLPNILLDSLVIPEALFSACTPEQLTHVLRDILKNTRLQKQQASAAEKVLCLLAPKVPSESGGQMSQSQRPSVAAANIVLSLLDECYRI